MFRKKVPKNSLSMRNANRSSDITKPNSSSLSANKGDDSSEMSDLSKLMGDLSDEENAISQRTSMSVMESFTQRQQSTPKSKFSHLSPVLKDSNNDKYNSNASQRENNSSSQKSFFHDMIARCGAVRLSGNSSYSLAVDQAHFSIKLNTLLMEDDSVKKFIKSFEDEISDMEEFKKLLAHTVTADECQVARGPIQDPLIRLLLNVDCLQVDVLDVLLGKLATVVMDGWVAGGNATYVGCMIDFVNAKKDQDNDDCAVVASTIRQFRYLNRVKECNVVQKLFEIIEMASVNTQREIIFSLPEIISVDEHELATKQLLDLLKFNSLLTHVVIDALANLSLSAQLRSQVRDKMLSRLDKCPPEYLPHLVQFIITRCSTEELPQVVDSLRKDLPFTMHHLEARREEASKNQKKGKKMNDEGSYVKLTFENLKFSLMTSKQMTDAWVKVITNVNNSAEFRCTDLVMLIIMYASVFGRKSQILTLFRNKIKSLVLTEVHVHQTFKILPVILMEYSSAVLELASVLLKSFESVVSEFAGILYETSFVHFHSYLRQNVISELLLHVGTGTSACINAALAILSRLSENHKEILREYTVSVMSLLIKLPDLEPMQVRNLVDVIAVLIFSNPDDSSGLQDELQMFIRKQISSPRMDQHKKGIVAAIMYAKQAAADRDVGDFNLNEINSLLETCFGSSSLCDSRRAFFNDEFGTLLREVKLHDRFIEVWEERTYRYALDHLFVRNIDVECEHFPMSLQFALETDDDRKFVFPAVDFVNKAFQDKSSSGLLTVAPSFIRLLWCSEQNFDKILPFLSASVIMPDQSVLENFDTLSMIQQKLILDSLFLCSNYFIECINAFCTQKTGDRVLIRIKQLMDLRKTISKHINKIPDYVPPVCQYYAPVQKINVKKRVSDSNKPKRGKKRKLDEDGDKDREQADPAEQPSTSAAEIVPETAALGPVSEDSDLRAYRGYFREIHCHTFKLLRMDLKLNPTKVFKKTKLSDAMINEEAWYYKATEKPELDTADLLFLLEDFLHKSENILKDKKYVGLHKTKSTSTAIECVSTEVFVTSSIKILPKICSKIEILSSYCKELLDANDKVYDAPGMYPKDAADIKLSLVAALKVVAELISWHGFRSSNYKSFLKDALLAIAKRGTATQESSVSVLAAETSNYLAGFAEHVLLISGGLSIVRAVQSCIDYCHVSSASQKCSLAKLCYDFLLRPWFTVTGAPERGAAFNQHVDSLLKTYFAVVENKLQVVKSVTQIVFDECENLTGKDAVLETFKTVNKGNFPLLYRSLCEALVTGASEKLRHVHEDHEACLKVWADIIQTLLMLVEIVKMHSSRINLSALLKRSQAILQLFLNKGMPVMESALRVKSTEVLKLLKSLQAVTRFLHSICCHSKLTSDATVAAHVPAIRSSCERLTLEVKGMLILNKIPLDCITIATLKNKDLQGNDILSQETPEDEMEEDESELPPEETSENEEESKDDDDVDPDGDISTQESNSEVY